MEKGIIIITEEEGRKLLDRGYETGKYEPHGKFITRMGWRKYAAIDNSTDDAWMEIFSSKRRAIERGGGAWQRQK